MADRICDNCKNYWYKFHTNPAECDAGCSREDELVRLEDQGVDTSEYGATEDCPLFEGFSIFCDKNICEEWLCGDRCKAGIEKRRPICV
jgi:hypothetical protein